MKTIDISQLTEDEIGDTIAAHVTPIIAQADPWTLRLMAAEYAAIVGAIGSGVLQGHKDFKKIVARAVDLGERTFGFELVNGGEGSSAKAAN